MLTEVLLDAQRTKDLAPYETQKEQLFEIVACVHVKPNVAESIFPERRRNAKWYSSSLKFHVQFHFIHIGQ